jgi:hypothetical protein
VSATATLREQRLVVQREPDCVDLIRVHEQGAKRHESGEQAIFENGASAPRTLRPRPGALA